MTAAAIDILTKVPWTRLLVEAPALFRQATAAAASINSLRSELMKSGHKKEGVPEAVARLSAEVEALASNQQQLADILAEASAHQQMIVSKIYQTRKILFICIGIVSANLVLIYALLAIR